jgi:hypothetical protein
MLLRKPLPLWLSVGLFALATAIMPLIGQGRHRPVSLPGTLTELTVLLSQKAPSLYVISEVEKYAESGMYICTRPQQREQLQRLTRNAQVIGASRIGRWGASPFARRSETSARSKSMNYKAGANMECESGRFCFSAIRHCSNAFAR